MSEPVGPTVAAEKGKAGAKAKPRAKGKKGRPKKKRTVTEADLIEFLLSTELLAGLPEETLVELAAGKVEFVEADAEEDVLKLEAGRAHAAPLLVVVKGELKVRGKSNGSWSLLNIVPRGELFFDKTVDPDGSSELTVTAMQPTEILKLAYEDANALLQADPSFKDRFMEILQGAAARKQDYFESETLAEISEFLGEHRLIGIQRLKVKRLDKCIDCDGCFEACANRHGVSRLGDYKAKHGLIGIPYNCHNCESPGCIPRCKFGHIGYTPEGEIQISDDCTGCTQCFRGCSYGSITMVPLDAMPEGYLHRSEGAKGKQVARKCDDCSGFQDQACISACPTGAIFQVSSRELGDYLSIFVTPGKAGGTVAALEQLAGSVSVEEAPWKGWRPIFMAFVAVISSILLWESVGRGWFQGITERWFSFSSTLYHLDLRAAAPVTGPDALRPGNQLSLLLGYLGAFAMILSQLYRVRRSVGYRMGSMRIWMEFHIYCGYLGGIFILFHALKPHWTFFANRWFFIAFVPMVVAILTGALGRYASDLLKTAGGGDLDKEQIDEEIKKVDKEVGGLIKTPQIFESTVKGATQIGMLNVDDLQALENAAALKRGMEATRRQGADGPGTDAGRLQRWLWTGKAQVAALGGRLKTRKAFKALRQDVMKMPGLAATERRQLIDLLKRRIDLEQSRHGFTGLSTLTSAWRLVHTSASYLMFATMMVHVVYEWIWLGKRALGP
jgi:Fe-S-cluster-containing hydrogenase component 2